MASKLWLPTPIARACERFGSDALSREYRLADKEAHVRRTARDLVDALLSLANERGTYGGPDASDLCRALNDVIGEDDHYFRVEAESEYLDARQDAKALGRLLKEVSDLLNDGKDDLARDALKDARRFNKEVNDAWLNYVEE